MATILKLRLGIQYVKSSNEKSKQPAIKDGQCKHRWKLLKTNQKEIQEIENNKIEIKNAFDMLNNV